jgi:hypothetical protein
MNKKFKTMWEIVEIPVYIMIFWSILSAALSAMKFIDIKIQSIIGWLIIIGAYGYIGYSSMSKKSDVVNAAKTGAFAGLIVGFVGAIIGIIVYYTMPEIFLQAIEDAIENGAPRELVETITHIMIYVGLIIQPIISAIIGAIISALGSLFNRK